MKEDESIQLQKGVYLPASISGLIIQLSNYDIVQLGSFSGDLPELIRHLCWRPDERTIPK